MDNIFTVLIIVGCLETIARISTFRKSSDSIFSGIFTNPEWHGYRNTAKSTIGTKFITYDKQDDVSEER
jgi:hypothetical protein